MLLASTSSTSASGCNSINIDSCSTISSIGSLVWSEPTFSDFKGMASWNFKRIHCSLSTKSCALLASQDASEVTSILILFHSDYCNFLEILVSYSISICKYSLDRPNNLRREVLRTASHRGWYPVPKYPRKKNSL